LNLRVQASLRGALVATLCGASIALFWWWVEAPQLPSPDADSSGRTSGSRLVPPVRPPELGDDAIDGERMVGFPEPKIEGIAGGPESAKMEARETRTQAAPDQETTPAASDRIPASRPRPEADTVPETVAAEEQAKSSVQRTAEHDDSTEHIPDPNRSIPEASPDEQPAVALSALGGGEGAKSERGVVLLIRPDARAAARFSDPLCALESGLYQLSGSRVHAVLDLDGIVARGRYGRGYVLATQLDPQQRGTLRAYVGDHGGARCVRLLPNPLVVRLTDVAANAPEKSRIRVDVRWRRGRWQTRAHVTQKG